METFLGMQTNVGCTLVGGLDLPESFAEIAGFGTVQTPVWRHRTPLISR
jgi:hypothetical protein